MSYLLLGYMNILFCRCVPSRVFSTRPAEAFKFSNLAMAPTIESIRFTIGESDAPW